LAKFISNKGLGQEFNIIHESICITSGKSKKLLNLAGFEKDSLGFVLGLTHNEDPKENFFEKFIFFFDFLFELC